MKGKSESLTRVQQLVEQRKEELMEKQADAYLFEHSPSKEQVNIRLNPWEVYSLDLAAEFLGETRAAAAAMILTSGLQDFVQRAGLPNHETKEGYEAYLRHREAQKQGAKS